jgi:hypothetical protein
VPTTQSVTFEIIVPGVIKSWSGKVGGKSCCCEKVMRQNLRLRYDISTCHIRCWGLVWTIKTTPSVYLENSGKNHRLSVLGEFPHP